MTLEALIKHLATLGPGKQRGVLSLSSMGFGSWELFESSGL